MRFLGIIGWLLESSERKKVKMGLFGKLITKVVTASVRNSTIRAVGEASAHVISVTADIITAT